MVPSSTPQPPSPEFVKYCRDQLKGLRANIDDFIEMLLSFPLNPSPDAKAMDYTHTPGKFTLWRGKEKNTAAQAVSMETTHKR